MAQVLKDEIRTALLTAALEVFAREGWRGATMVAIARAAQISVGNIYRYFTDKRAIFNAALPDPLAQLIGAQVLRYAAALLEATTATDALADLHAHRHAALILLAYDEGTPHAGFAAARVEAMVAHATAWHDARHPRCPLTAPQRFALARSCDNLLFALVEALTHHDHPDDAARAIDAYARYHAAGLRALLDTEP